MAGGSMNVRGALSAALAASLAALVLAAPALVHADSPLKTHTKAQLEHLKLAEEVQKLQDDNSSNFGDAFAKYAPLVTAVVAVVGLIGTLLKLLFDQKAQRKSERDQREAEMTQREVESERRLEDRFAAILTELGSEAAAAKAGAATSLVTYLEPQHKRFHHQVRLAVLTNLKFPHEEPIRKLLARVYVESLRSSDDVNEFERDLSGAKLANTDFSRVDLAETDIAFADLRNSNLSGANLYRARGHSVILDGARFSTHESPTSYLIEVRFKGARCRGTDFSTCFLINAHLKEADLREARFQGSGLQAAHFEGANLTGAKFQQADLADTYFWGATMDEACKRTISRAYRWRKAHFDDGVCEEIEALAAS
jgi:uncharacterized protein YjbI with pentapeptide repeats